MDTLIDTITHTARQDARGCPTSSASARALDHVEDALESMLSYFGDPLQALDQACAADPTWQYPHTLKASLLLTLGEFGPTQLARDVLAASEALAFGTNTREQAHRAAAQAAAGGN